MSRLALKVLGEFEIRDGAGRLVTVKARKNRALLAVLALSPSCSMTRERMAGLLWSDRGEAQARSSLRQALVALRKDLPDAGTSLLVIGDERVKLVPEHIEVDALQLRQLGVGRDAETLRRASALYRGALLTDCTITDPAFESWLADERRRLRDLAVGVLDKLFDHETGATRIDVAQRLVDLDPSRELSYRRLMLAYVEVGERTLALRQYETLRDMLRDELDAAPEPETEALRRRLLKNMPGNATMGLTDIRGAPLETLGLSEEVGPRSLADSKAPGDERPVIAVLPFDVFGGDSLLEEFSNGLTEDIITALSHVKAMRVIARNTTFAFKGRASDIRRIAEEVGARYVLEGSVRRSGELLRVSGQLIEATNGHHVWADRIDRRAADIFEKQDEITASIVASVQSQVIHNEGRFAALGAGPDARSPQLLAQAWQKLLILSAPSLASCQSLTKAALALDGRSALADRMMAVALYHQAYMGYVPWTLELIKDVFRHAQASVEADDADEYCHWAMAIAHLLRKEHDLSLASLARALEINPNCSLVIGSTGTVLAWAGQAEASIERNELALKLNRQDPSNFFRYFGLALAHYMAGRYTRALECARIVRQTRTDWWLGQMVVAASLGQLHGKKEAQSSVEDLQHSQPNFASMFAMLPFARFQDRDHFALGLEKAGFVQNDMTVRGP